MSNPYGDVELDAQGMRALAHPVRLAILTRLQQNGPHTATGLAPHVGASPSVTSWHLRHLAKHGLVRDAETLGNGRERWWEAASRGFRVSVKDEVGRHAARALRDAMDATEGDPVGEWQREVEPLLELEWLDLSGLSDTTILVTREELEQVEGAMEQLLAPYVLRKDAPAVEVPDEARLVRIRRRVLPSAEARHRHRGTDAVS
ncbi:MAG: ArsR/SmtB family transcription factor [Marmoricola sp.]